MKGPSRRDAADLAQATSGALRGLARTGLFAPVRPDRLLRMAAGAARSGPSLAAIVAAGAARHPGRAAVLDEQGSVSYAELSRRAGAIAGALRAEHQIVAGRRLGILCRNGRGIVEALTAGSRTGADLVLLNTDFSGPALGEVAAREKVAALVVDDDLRGALRRSGLRAPVLAAPEGLDQLAATGGRPGPPRRMGSVVLLTSGTTGTPKGANRSPSPLGAVGPMATLLARVPMRSGDRMLVGPPIFHGLGLAFAALGLATGQTLVLRRRFDPAETLRTIDADRVAFLSAVPLMLQRMLDVPAPERARLDTSSLRTVISGGSSLAPDLALAFMDAFGDVLFDLYGTTEAGWGAMADPHDLRSAPGTVGRAPIGTSVRILDADGHPLPSGRTGRIFLRTGLLFDTYTGGGGKEVIDGFMSTGDLGHVDAAGRLFVEGRDDDMIVSGGENVFPQEVQETLAAHPDVVEVAVYGVPDEQFGQRLAAWVVLRAGMATSADELRAFVRDRLARFKAPRDIHLVDELPRTATGKVARRALVNG